MTADNLAVSVTSYSPSGKCSDSAVTKTKITMEVIRSSLQGKEMSGLLGALNVAVGPGVNTAGKNDSVQSCRLVQQLSNPPRATLNKDLLTLL